jgi:hypothetical protein
MLEPVIAGPMLNPMHPSLAKELTAVPIRVFGLSIASGGWRRRGFGGGRVFGAAGESCGNNNVATVSAVKSGFIRIMRRARKKALVQKLASGI